MAFDFENSFEIPRNNYQKPPYSPSDLPDSVD